jgi:Holliday junction resolvase RusA-like endonuclease
VGEVRVVVPGPVISENRALRFTVRGGRVMAYRTRECTVYQDTVAAYARAARGPRAPLEGRLEVLLTLVAPNRASLPDADGAAKAPLDALQGILYRNDRQIDHLSVWRRIVPGQAHRLEVVVRPLGPAAVPLAGGEA